MRGGTQDTHSSHVACSVIGDGGVAIGDTISVNGAPAANGSSGNTEDPHGLHSMMQKLRLQRGASLILASSLGGAGAGVSRCDRCRRTPEKQKTETQVALFRLGPMNIIG